MIGLIPLAHKWCPLIGRGEENITGSRFRSGTVYQVVRFSRINSNIHFGELKGSKEY